MTGSAGPRGSARDGWLEVGRDVGEHWVTVHVPTDLPNDTPTVPCHCCGWPAPTRPDQTGTRAECTSCLIGRVAVALRSRREVLHLVQELSRWDGPTPIV